MDLLDKIDNALDAYSHALQINNGHSAFSQRQYIENNSVSWLHTLITECRAHRTYGMTADTAAQLSASGETPKQLVYVCSPLRGNIRANVKAARGYCEEVIAAGYIPIAPHVMFYGICNDRIPEQRAAGMSMGIELLRMCRELWIFGPSISRGMQTEIKQAQFLKIPVIDKRG